MYKNGNRPVVSIFQNAAGVPFATEAELLWFDMQHVRAESLHAKSPSLVQLDVKDDGLQ